MRQFLAYFLVLFLTPLSSSAGDIIEFASESRTNLEILNADPGISLTYEVFEAIDNTSVIDNATAFVDAANQEDSNVITVGSAIDAVFAISQGSVISGSSNANSATSALLTVRNTSPNVQSFSVQAEWFISAVTSDLDLNDGNDANASANLIFFEDFSQILNMSVLSLSLNDDGRVELTDSFLIERELNPNQTIEFDFFNATSGSAIGIASEVIPEPSSLFVFSTLALGCLTRRRR